ncbi:substrate-binding domain-containing protein [Halalkalibacterium halodurans]|uniref:substrate-binding domain-containing protein n=1 Tax=Halalkalibacterium halodurans TaxID=86665 RepID=UPI002E1FC9CA|nr:substrate-binding domain-containing protein [Halalkalibacterium halodurans]MED4083357.1 substrate-binding domain-containing protein [Halalkalibacterium halodurans]MED4105099.1 substrate-binding domain-containing protein [Halalkalibacterium halodurans]MED4109417.1 substrate-binding domain-containing protein [Halalkalibacterium halodurans]MED4147257.1 substrate-binding domain-containing protein [Halalkalibacterium halodurans]
MKKLLLVYVALIGLFMLYVYHAHFKEPIANPWDTRGLQGDLNETYMMITFQSGMDYWKRCLKGFEDAAQALNVTVEYRGAAQYDIQEQITVLEQAIAKNPAGIAISAIDPVELTDTINKAVDAGIPIVLFDSGAPDSHAHSFLGTNNYNAGMNAAYKMAELLEGEGEVAVITLPNQLNHQERTTGFKETLEAEFPAIEVVAVEDGRGDSLHSRRVAHQLLEDYPNLAGIFATEANGGVGVGDAVRLESRAGEIQIISFDTDKGTLDLVDEGIISATLAQGTWNMGYWSLTYLFHLHHGLTEPQILQTREEAPLPLYVDTGITIVTDENVDYYYAD